MIRTQVALRQTRTENRVLDASIREKTRVRGLNLLRLQSQKLANRRCERIQTARDLGNIVRRRILVRSDATAYRRTRSVAGGKDGLRGIGREWIAELGRAILVRRALYQYLDLAMHV